FEQWPEAFEAFERDRDRDWAGDYRASPFHGRYIADATEQPPQPRSGPVVIAPPPRPRSRTAQLSTLVRRYAAALSADRTVLAFSIGLPFVMGAVARALAGGALARETVSSTLLILCVGALLTGAASAVRDLVKDRSIHRPERAVGLCRSAHLLSEIVVL